MAADIVEFLKLSEKNELVDSKSHFRIRPQWSNNVKIHEKNGKDGCRDNNDAPAHVAVTGSPSENSSARDDDVSR